MIGFHPLVDGSEAARLSIGTPGWCLQWPQVSGGDGMATTECWPWVAWCDDQ